MEKRKTVLIFTGDSVTLAAAVKTRLKEKGVLTVIVNEHELLGSIWSFVKERVIRGKAKEKLDSFLDNYQEKRKEKEGSTIPKWLENYAKTDMKNVLTRYRPDLTVVLTPNVLRLLTEVKEDVCPDMPVFAVPEDFVLDYRFAQKGTRFIVDNVGVMTTLANCSITPDNVSVCPLPPATIAGGATSFTEKTGKRILIDTAGRDDFLALADVLSLLKGQAEQLIFYTEENRTLFRTLREKGFTAQNEGRTREEMYLNADVAVMPPVSEIARFSFAMGVPTVLTLPKTSFETRNAEYLEKNNNAFYAKSVQTVESILKDWLSGTPLPSPATWDHGESFFSRIERELGV